MQGPCRCLLVGGAKARVVARSYRTAAVGLGVGPRSNTGRGGAGVQYPLNRPRCEMEEQPMVESRTKSFGEKWSDARPTKTIVFWACLASMVATMIVGFTWGGWVTGGTAVRMAEAFGEDAVAKRLAPMFVVRFHA